MFALQLSHPLRSYLNLRRTRAILGCFLVISLVFVAFSAIDIRISSLFYDRGFYMANQSWTQLLHRSVTWFVVGSVVSVVAVYAFNRLAGRNVLGISGLKVVYLLLVLALGAGLVVNGILKDGFGRARPREIQQFGGTRHFTPAFVVSSACDRNCAFSSGDTAGAFFSLAFIVAMNRKRAITTAAVGFGVLVSAARIASGAHFLSDTVVSFFVMLVVADALYYRMFLYAAEPRALAPAPGAAVLVSVAEKPAARL